MSILALLSIDPQHSCLSWRKSKPEHISSRWAPLHPSLVNNRMDTRKPANASCLPTPCSPSPVTDPNLPRYCRAPTLFMPLVITLFSATFDCSLRPAHLECGGGGGCSSFTPPDRWRSTSSLASACRSPPPAPEVSAMPEPPPLTGAPYGVVGCRSWWWCC